MVKGQNKKFDQHAYRSMGLNGKKIEFSEKPKVVKLEPIRAKLYGFVPQFSLLTRVDEITGENRAIENRKKQPKIATSDTAPARRAPSEPSVTSEDKNKYMDWMKQLSLFHQLKDKMDTQKAESFNENYKKRVLEMLLQREKMIEDMSDKVNNLKNGASIPEQQDDILLNKIEQLESKLQNRISNEQNARTGSNQMEQKLNYMFDMMMYNMSSMQQMMANVSQMQKAQVRISNFQTQMLRNLPFMNPGEMNIEDPFDFLRKSKKKSIKGKKRRSKKSSYVSQSQSSVSGTGVSSRRPERSESTFKSSSTYISKGSKRSGSSRRGGSGSGTGLSKSTVKSDYKKSGGSLSQSKQFRITSDKNKEKKKKRSKLNTIGDNLVANSEERKLKNDAQFRYSGRNSEDLRRINSKPLKMDEIVEEPPKGMSEKRSKRSKKSKKSGNSKENSRKIETKKSTSSKKTKKSQILGENDKEKENSQKIEPENPQENKPETLNSSPNIEDNKPEEANNDPDVAQVNNELIKRILSKRKKMGTDNQKMNIDSPLRVKRPELEAPKDEDF